MLDRYQAIDPSKLDLAPGMRILDVGCGTGRHLVELSRFPSHLVGLDMSREDLHTMWCFFDLISRERPFLADVHMIEGAGEWLPFPDGQFDRVICTETLEHVPDDATVLRELLRVLHPDGVLAVSVPDEYSERLLWRLSSRYREAPGGHIRLYRRKAIASLLRENGVEPFAVQYRHSLESLRWLVRSVIDKEWGKPGRIARSVSWLLDTPSHRNWRILAWCDALGNRILPKSIVLYGRKLERQQL